MPGSIRLFCFILCMASQGTRAIWIHSTAAGHRCFLCGAEDWQTGGCCPGEYLRLFNHFTSQNAFHVPICFDFRSWHDVPISNTIGWLHPFPNPKSLTRSVGFTSMLLRRDPLKHCVCFSFDMRGFTCLLLAALLWHRMLLMRKGCCLEPALILGGVEHRLSSLTVFLSFGGVRSMPEDSGHGSYQKRFSP